MRAALVSDVGAVALAVVAGLLVLAGADRHARPRGPAHRRADHRREAVRLLPDVLVLVRRLAGDRSLPGSVRWRLLLLLGYLVLPIDLVPDFIPVVGYADDALLVAWVLRSVVRTAGPEALDRHWPGTPRAWPPSGVSPDSVRTCLASSPRTPPRSPRHWPATSARRPTSGC